MHIVEHAMGAIAKGYSHRRRNKPSAPPDQQRIARHVPQPLEASAHGRRCQIQLPGRTGDRALLEKGVKRGQKIEVDGRHPPP
ncbi:hypothetical protein GCM10025867_08380 [Frondihabitans sucicola]|uniref:Uncharacterized protein n=1 Tax=Frondihabitans sucicola TaxID=1268041 RepID=A0ABM8GK83_9MICO|nr:hypothetical protein GCM10025867_08380 [Frondihabitans sucicola]